MQEEHPIEVTPTPEGTGTPATNLPSRIDPPTPIELTIPDAPRPRSRLTPAQEIALQQLAAGTSIAQAARLAQVDRRTVHRWLRADPHFAAAYNAWQREVVASGRARVLAMNELALDTVQSAMLQGDARIAVQVAKANGALNAPKPGTTDPDFFHHRKKLRDRARRKKIEDAERDERSKQRDRYEKSPSHCEYMIDSYIKCRREALRAESPEARELRLKEQPKYRRNYDPMTLRLFRTMDAEDEAANAPAAASSPDAQAANNPSGDPTAQPTVADADHGGAGGGNS